MFPAKTPKTRFKTRFLPPYDPANDETLPLRTRELIVWRRHNDKVPLVKLSHGTRRPRLPAELWLQIVKHAIQWRNGVIPDGGVDRYMNGLVSPFRLSGSAILSEAEAAFWKVNTFELAVYYNSSARTYFEQSPPSSYYTQLIERVQLTVQCSHDMLLSAAGPEADTTLHLERTIGSYLQSFPKLKHLIIMRETNYIDAVSKCCSLRAIITSRFFRAAFGALRELKIPAKVLSVISTHTSSKVKPTLVIDPRMCGVAVRDSILKSHLCADSFDMVLI